MFLFSSVVDVVYQYDHPQFRNRIKSEARSGEPRVTERRFRLQIAGVVSHHVDNPSDATPSVQSLCVALYRHASNG